MPTPTPPGQDLPGETPPRRVLAAIAMILAAVLCFSGLDASGKWVNRTTDPFQTAAVRYIGSFLLVGLFYNPLLHRRRMRVGLPRTRSPWLQVIRATSLVAATLFSFYAYLRLPLTQVTAINFASPLLVALLAGPVLGEWPGPRRLAAVGVGFAGVLIATRPGTGGLQLAAGAALLTALCSACYAMLTRVLAARDPPLTTLFYTGLVGCVLMLPVVPSLWADPPQLRVWPALALMGCLGTVGHWLLILAHQRAPASTLAPFFYGQLLGAAVLGWLLFNEVPDRWTVLGGGIITASGLYLLFHERRPA